MGQYHSVYNLDKKECLHPHSMGDGAKLLEWGCGGLMTAGLAVLLCNSNGRGGGDLKVEREFVKQKDGNYDYAEPTATQLEWIDAVKAVQGRWAGDRIVVQGDYAKEGDPAYIPSEDLEDFTNIAPRVIAALSADCYLREERMTKGYLTEKYVTEHVITQGVKEPEKPTKKSRKKSVKKT